MTTPVLLRCDSPDCGLAAAGEWLFPSASPVPLALCSRCYVTLALEYASHVSALPEHAIRRLA